MTDCSCENTPDTKSHPGYSLSFLCLVPFIISPFVFAVCPLLHFHTLCISELPVCRFFPGWRRSKNKTPSFAFNLPSNPVRKVMVVPISQVVKFRIMFSQVHTAIERWSWDRNLAVSLLFLQDYAAFFGRTHTFSSFHIFFTFWYTLLLPICLI